MSGRGGDLGRTVFASISRNSAEVDAYEDARHVAHAGRAVLCSPQQAKQDRGGGGGSGGVQILAAPNQGRTVRRLRSGQMQLVQSAADLPIKQARGTRASSGSV